ncbi:hypothetical protein [Nocardia cyriacigeorgica]|uniref:hypothetical protein n=1 Tax=Nocardia cyriacigeorgica TaxID=135487 RepID=UPI001E2A9B9A|nr:hypothetical protein [Nocardia cyriacigeorgica]
MHDQHGVLGPDVLGDRGGEHGRHDQLRPEVGHPRAQQIVTERQFHSHLVAACAQFGVHALGEAVEGTGN